MDIARTGFLATGGDGCALQVLGLAMDLRLEHLPRHLSHLLNDGQRSGGNAVEIGGLPNVLHQTFAPREELLYDRVMVHGVPPDEQVDGLGSH